MPTPERLNRVTFRIGERMVEMPWGDRDALLARAKQLPHGRLTGVCSRIEGAGASRPIEIHLPEELDALHDFLREWTRREGKRAPQSVRTLNREVKDELDWLLGPE